MLFRNKFYYSFLSQDASASHQLDFVNKDKQYFQYNIQPRRNVVPMHYKSHCQLHLWWLYIPLYFLYSKAQFSCKAHHKTDQQYFQYNIQHSTQMECGADAL